LRRVLRGRERRWLISIPAHEVKSRVDLTYELPPDAHGMIEGALALYDQPDGWLFPGRGRGPKATSLLSGQIKRTVQSRLGLAFHTHMFRALPGTSTSKRTRMGSKQYERFSATETTTSSAKTIHFLPSGH
jgi:hypothetical protein